MNKNNYMGVWIFSMILMFSVGIFSYVRNTYADFNGVTGNLSIPLVKVTYSSNYPKNLNMSDEIKIYSDEINSVYFIERNMFEVPTGYVFYSWNTMRDGTGREYNEGRFNSLYNDLNLYAIWVKKILGDINLDGLVNDADIILLQKHLDEEVYLTGIVSTNSDINLDGKIDLVDVDIIKQALLGIDGYTILLSNEPVLIYEVYVPSLNNGNGADNKDDNKNNNGGNGTSNNGGGNTSSNKPNKENGGGSNTSSNSGGNNKQEDITNDIDKDNDKLDNGVIDNVDGNHLEKDNSKSYLWLFIVGICLISFRIIIGIVRMTVNKNKN